MKKLLKSSTFIILAIAAIAYVGRYFYMQPNVNDGELAPDFESTLLSGEDFKLSDLRGNYVLLDFWGSWCGPCIVDNPKLKDLYGKYNGENFKSAKGFEIVGVAVESNAARWPKAVKRFGLTWPYQILDEATSLRFFDSKLAKLYGVADLPAKFLIDPSGKTIGVNQPVEEIAAFLETELKK